MTLMELHTDSHQVLPTIGDENHKKKPHKKIKNKGKITK